MTTTAAIKINHSFQSEEEFLEFCEFASHCDLNRPASFGDDRQWPSVLLLLNHYFVWSLEVEIEFSILASIQKLLRSRAVCSELATALFRHGTPTDSQAETTFRLLFLAALCRHRMIGCKAKNTLNIH